MKKPLIVIASLVLLVGFKWVKLTAEGEKVRVLEPKEVTSCKMLGETTSSVKASIGPFGRNEQKVKRDLEYLARNSAAADFKDKQADTVVPVGEVENGKQSFKVYRCVNP